MVCGIYFGSVWQGDCLFEVGCIDSVKSVVIWKTVSFDCKPVTLTLKNTFNVLSVSLRRLPQTNVGNNCRVVLTQFVSDSNETVTSCLSNKGQRFIIIEGANVWFVCFLLKRPKLDFSENFRDWSGVLRAYLLVKWNRRSNQSFSVHWQPRKVQRIDRFMSPPSRKRIHVSQTVDEENFGTVIEKSQHALSAIEKVR